MNMDELLPKVKKTELEILNFVHDFCIKNKIKYALAYGTLIGAIRHKGFIPWDDDIDIFMLREDYNKFVDLWNLNPPTGYILQTKQNSPDFTQCMAKVRKNHTTFLQASEENYKYHKGIFIDIFILDHVADNAYIQKLQKIRAMVYCLFTRDFAFDRGSKFVELGCNILLKAVPKSKHMDVVKHMEKKLSKYNKHLSNDLICYTCLSTFSEYFPPNLMNELILLPFEGKDFYCPKQYDYALKQTYGDYMQLPPESERTWKHNPQIIDFEHNYEELIGSNE